MKPIRLSDIDNIQAGSRSYFEDDTEFGLDDQFTTRLLTAYGDAAEKARRSANLAIRSGEMSDLRAAQWNEAVCITIENILCLLPHRSEESGLNKFDFDAQFDCPSQPRF